MIDDGLLELARTVAVEAATERLIRSPVLAERPADGFLGEEAANAAVLAADFHQVVVACGFRVLGASRNVDAMWSPGPPQCRENGGVSKIARHSWESA